MVRNRSQLLNGHEMEVKKIIVVRQTTKAVASKLSLKKKNKNKNKRAEQLQRCSEIARS